MPHLVEVNRATQFLLRQLHCDNWYVACRHDHQIVIRLTRGTIAKYAVAFQCRPDVEKAIYHGSRAWALSIIPLTSEGYLSNEQVADIKSALTGPQLEP